MKNHQIELHEMLSFKNNKLNDEIVYASQLPLKKLTLTLNNGFRVYHNGELEYDGQSSSEAVSYYNAL